MSFFSRIFRIGQAEAHSVIDKFEDPIKMTEQGIRDLKKDLQGAMTSLAEVKAIAIRTRRDADNKKKLAADYERKAMLLLQKAQGGTLDMSDAERLATEALAQKEQVANEALRVSQEAERHEQMANQLQANVNKIKSSVSTYENDLTTLKARARTASSTKKINQQLAKVDASGTIAMLEKMKSKVEEDESLAIAYADMATPDKSIDREIDSALQAGQTATTSASLLELKKKMGIE
ncbi:phage shock protein A [Desulfonema ishimotonii]|uniref:Phage shock protein A n=1 Tax=Desulfonema ishimotonii TaxID=45657 RepID=A0A401FWB0_9BACT|nr:PspA/IM30 family protein [Desulfonema ishimotonii]GBC61233.1 phage shock protein A [Desulfonema ishimotonii]